MLRYGIPPGSIYAQGLDDVVAAFEHFMARPCNHVAVCEENYTARKC
jgi:hypothetical protein